MPSVVNDMILKEITEEFGGNPYAFISNFSGVTVAEISELRRNLEKCSKRSLVVKHSLVRKAVGEMDLENVDVMKGLLKEHILITMGDKDPQEISKALVEFSKTNEKFTTSGVVFEKKVYDEAFVKSLAKLPSKQELLTQLVVRIKSPISGVVITLGQVVKGLAVALNEIKKQKEAAAT